MEVAIAGEGIGGTGAGLGYFLFRGLAELTSFMPDWQFRVVVGNSFKRLEDISAPNLEILFWNDKRALEALGSVLWRFLRGSQVDAACQRISGYLPTMRLKAACGNLKAIWHSLKGADVIWVPHYLIGAYTKHLSPMANLSRLGVPLVMTVHDIHPVFFPDDWPPSSLRRFWEEFVPFAKSCSTIITHSNFQKQMMVEHLGIPADKILVVHCPPLINPRSWMEKVNDAESEAVLKDHGIERPFFLYPGSSTITHKNHVRLILAWKEIHAELAKECPLLVCTAKSPNWAVIKALIDSLDLEDKVVFTDRVDDRTLSVLYHRCMSVVIPTLYEGGGSGPAVEAILAGKPVLCSDIPQIVEQIDNAGCSVTTFDPRSVESIVETLLRAIDELPTLEAAAAENQRILSSRLDEHWRNWAAFYTSRFQQAAEERETRSCPQAC